LTTLHTSWSFATYLGTAYLGESGSYVHGFQFCPSTSAAGNYVVGSYIGNVGCGSLTLPNDLTELATGRGSIPSHNSVGVAYAEVRPPDRNPARFRHTCNYADPSFSSEQYPPVEVVAMVSVQSAQALPKCWVRAGDDWVVGGFLSAPILKPRE